MIHGLGDTQSRENPAKTLGDLVPLNIIRQETVLSRLPIHCLSKKGSVDINIERKNGKGEVIFRWKVEPNPTLGSPGQLAYKLDTLVVNRRFDELGRPLPEYVRLGSLREIGRELGLGSNTSKVINALRQNARTTIIAKLHYKDQDGNEQSFNFEESRYGLVFTGQKFTTGPRAGEKADAVYLSLHPTFRHLLNSARMRPLDYDYLRDLSPAAQRFYELASYPIYGALKYKHPHAKLLYSEYCLFSAQKRHFDYENFRVQMYKVYRPHIKAGYILKNVRHEETTDSEGHRDWVMVYTPGPKAKAEYRTFNKNQLLDGDMPPEDEIADHGGTLHDIVAGSSADAQTPDPMDAQAKELVRAFHRLFHNASTAYPHDKELAQAKNLLAKHGFERAHHIVEYTHRMARETNYKPAAFGGILHYATPALAHYDEERTRKQAESLITRCELCNEAGIISFRKRDGEIFSACCPHDLTKIRARESRDGLTRL